MAAGAIDYARRFDLMQQHTGEHMVSGIISRRFGYHNVGFHVGAELVTIDFDGPITAGELAEIENEANRLLWQDLPVKCWYPSREALPHIPYRSKRELNWPVRVVEIPGVDCCACCGIHTARTGEVGLVKLFSVVKFHQGVRIEMACGGRALDLLSRVFEENRRVSQAFSVKWLETGDGAQRMNEALGREKLRASCLQRQVFASVAKGYAGAERVLHFDDLEPGRARLLAEAIAEEISGVAAVAGGKAEDLSLCLIGPAPQVTALSKALREAGARGGGKPGTWQGKASMTEEQLQSLLEQDL